MRYFGFIILSILLLSCKQAGGEHIEMISAKQVYEAVYGKAATEGTQLIDVRTPEEYSVSHLKEAQNICVTSADFEEKAASLDKTKPVYVYCKGGRRSAKAAKILEEMGFTQVYDLQGGIRNWTSEGFKTTQ